MKILVVDDEKIILQGIVRLLKSNPLVDDVYWAEDAFIALDFLKGHQVDAVVTDIRMPEMDGLELIKIAREEELCDNFIILSGFAEFKYAQQAISYQVTEYILKPVDPEELDKAVRDIKYKTELKEKNRNNQENSVVTSEELEEKIRLETYKETEIEWILQNILLLPDIRHPQSQKIRMILEYIFIHPNAKDAVGDFIGKSNFLPVDCAAQSLYEVMCFYVKRESHPSSVVNALLITIEQYRNAEVCLDYVAGQLFINSNYLSGLISRSIGISFHSFVRLLRVSFAQEMLKNTRNYSMEAIGYKSGFSNTNMFFRTFRDITGITPKTTEQEESSMSGLRAKPTKEMLEWHDYELGVFFHYDIEVFQPEYSFGEDLIPASKWNPVKLDTDQWVRTAKAAGARYALITAKHGTGFCLWPTRFHDYHVGNASVTRDVVGEFVDSCRKYGIKPGIYYSLGSSHLDKICMGEDGQIDIKKKNDILLGQVEELITAYGPLAEFWFDGGILRPELGGPDIPGLLARIAPDLICFGGCPGIKNILRWSGSEQGVAVPECWSAAHFLTEPERKNVTCDSEGDPEDEVWAPVEVDMPVRDVMFAYMGGWMYHEKDADKTYDSEYLFERYLTSVGRNANLLIGCVPDTKGLISQDQVDSFVGLGNLINTRLTVHAGMSDKMIGKDRMEVWFDDPVDAEFAEIMEDQSDGQKVLEWILETRWPAYWCTKDGMDQWIPIAQGKSIGHKRIIPIGHLRGYAFRFRILKSFDGAVLKSFRIFGKKVSMEYHEHMNI